MKKNKKIVIAIVIVAVLILVVGIALAFVLKNNNKEEFFKYISQIFDSENGFIDNRIENYNQKKASNTFENVGKLTFNVPTEGMDTKTANEINNNFNISFMGNFDNENQKAEELIKINYDNENNFPILYKKVGNIQAIKLNQIVKKYLAVKDLDIMGMLNMGGRSSLSTDSSAVTNGSSAATKAVDAKKRADLGAGKDAVDIETQTLLLDLYATGNTQPSAEDIADKFLSHQYNSEYATITTKKEMTEDSVGTINIVSNEDKTYAIIGTVSKTGKIDWKEEFGTYNTEKTELAENTDNTENNDKADLKQKIEDYLQSIKPMIDEKEITKVSSSDASGFSLEISNEKLIQIIGIILDKMYYEDERPYEDRVYSDDTLTYYKQSFSNIIPKDGKVIVTIYQKDEKTNRICIEISDHLKIDVKKLEQNDELSYDISLTQSKANNNILAKAVIGFTGLDSLETVNENYNIGIDLNGNSYTYNIENEVNFTDDIEIKDFAEKEFTDISKLSQTNQIKLFQTILERFNKINNELMKKVKIDPENFWYNLVPKNSAPEIDADEDDYSLDLDDKDDEDEDDDEASQTSNATKKIATDSNTTSTNNDSDENLAKSFAETEKNVFNSKYEKYKGDEVEGSKVKQLIMNIIANNMADEERQIKVTGDIALTGNEVPDSLETSKNYSVEFKKSKEGYVNEAVIKVVE